MTVTILGGSQAYAMLENMIMIAANKFFIWWFSVKTQYLYFGMKSQ
jgi:hypothetical protein